MQAARVAPFNGIYMFLPTILIVAVGSVLMGCQKESQPAFRLDERARSLLSPAVRKDLERTQVQVLLPATLAPTQTGSMAVTDNAYEWSSQWPDVRIHLRGVLLEPDGVARTALLGTVETHLVRGRTVMVAVVPGSTPGLSSYSARWAEGNGRYSVDVSCVHEHVTCKTNEFVLQIVQDLALVWGGRR